MKTKYWRVSTGVLSYPINVYEDSVFSYSFGTKKFGKTPTREMVRNWLIEMEKSKI